MERRDLINTSFQLFASLLAHSHLSVLYRWPSHTSSTAVKVRAPGRDRGFLSRRASLDIPALTKDHIERNKRFI